MDNTYWQRKYTHFTDKILRTKKQYYEAMALEIGEEIEFLKQSKIENLRQDPERMVLLLYVNHELNLLDPIGVYPAIATEYESYARRIVDAYKCIAPEEFRLKLVQELEYMWSCIGQDPKNHRKTIDNGATKIQQAIQGLYTRRW